MTAQTHTCTVRTAVSGVCGKPAVYTFQSRIGDEVFAECAEHYAGPVYGAPAAAGPQVGDAVEVARYGKTYRATVTRVGARGAVYATFTYGNGATRTVRV